LTPSKLTEVVLAQGNANVLATHPSTLEITKDTELSRRGDCVIAVAANRGLGDLGSSFKQNLRKEGARVMVLIQAGKITDTINAHGDPRLTLSHPTDMIIRKSGYVCSRTLAVGADKAACSLSRRLVEKLKNPAQEVRVTLIIRTQC
jgi:hypothetical protein